MHILGIDQSYTNCGLILLDSDTSNIITWELFKANKKKDRFAQANDIASCIGGFCVKHKPDYIYIEGLAFGMIGNVTRDLAGLQFIIINRLRYRHGYEGRIEILPPTSLKKYAVGKGNAKKDVLYESLPEDVQSYIDGTGVKKTTGRYDLTDAYYLAKYGVDNANLQLSV